MKLVSTTRGSRGFSPVRRIAIVAILGILVGMALPMARNSLKREREAELRQSLQEMRVALDKFKEASNLGRIEVPTDTEGYPQTLDVMIDGVRFKALRKIPR